MYHRIVEESFDPWGLAVSPAHFADQIEWIARKRTPLSLAEFARLHLQGQLPRRAIAVTFDDGYACNAEVAVPILERLGVPATIFLPVELIERRREFWWDELERMVMGHGRATLGLDGVVIQLGEPAAADQQWSPGKGPITDRQRAYQLLWTMLHRKAPAELQGSMEQLRSQAPVPDQPRRSHRPLTPTEVRTIRSSILDLGSHALTHTSLPNLSPGEKAHEIDSSVERFAALTGEQPRTFAYPHGEFDRESELLVEKSGFLCACTTEPGSVGRKSRQFALPRHTVGNVDSAALARQVRAA